MYQTNLAYQAYQQNQISTATPERLVVMLYDGGIRFLTLAETAFQKNKYEDIHNNLVKTQAIIVELMSNVDQSTGEIGEKLYLLYDYMNQRLIEANLKKNPQMVAEVKELLISLKETWFQAMQLAKAKPGQANPGSP